MPSVMYLHESSHAFSKLDRTQPTTPSIFRYPPWSLTVRPWKWIVGRWISYWEGNFSGLLLLNFGGVCFCWFCMHKICLPHPHQQWRVPAPNARNLDLSTRERSNGAESPRKKSKNNWEIGITPKVMQKSGISNAWKKSANTFFGQDLLIVSVVCFCCWDH